MTTPTPPTQPTPQPTEAEIVRPDPRSLRALTHPLRLRLLGLLRSDGPATASQLGERTGQSSGATSYHLRQLAAYGFIVEDAGQGNNRDRWWRAVHRSTRVDLPEHADEEAELIGEQYLRVVASGYAGRVDATIANLPTIEDDLGPGWREAFSLSNHRLRLTRDEARQLVAEVEKLAERFRRDDPELRDDAPDDAERVEFQYAVLPERSERT